ncbi:MAG: hypothetical protein K2N27_05720, partial [Ruminococcus sp.]|nr:hypothetical protein [Ruminococcus sp.]
FIFVLCKNIIYFLHIVVRSMNTKFFNVSFSDEISLVEIFINSINVVVFNKLFYHLQGIFFQICFSVLVVRTEEVIRNQLEFYLMAEFT